MRVCLKKGCRISVTDDMLACREHWLQLPAHIRKGLIRAKSKVVLKNRRPVEVPENEPLMKACAEEAKKHWGDDAGT